MDVFFVFLAGLISQNTQTPAISLARVGAIAPQGYRSQPGPAPLEKRWRRQRAGIKI